MNLFPHQKYRQRQNLWCGSLFVFLLVLNLFKFLIARYFPLIGDEAYYWLWGQHLDLSYVDHPPMIAYVNFFITSLFGRSEWAVRLGAITIVLLISWIIYLTGKELRDQRTGTATAIVFNLLPIFFCGGFFLVPQTLLFLFWSLSFYLLVKITKTGQAHYWYLLGFSTGLGLLSDYVMALFLAGTAFFLFFNRQNRFWLTKKEPYLSLGLCLLLFSPVIYWNIVHHFPSLSYHGERLKLFSLGNILYFVILQIFLYTPAMFISAAKKSLQLKAELSNIFSAVVFIPFALLSPFVMIGGHWTAAGYLPSILSEEKKKSIILFALIVNSLAFTYYVFLYPTPKGMIPNQELAKYLAGEKLVIANNLGLAALVAFHGKTRVYMPAGGHPQYDLWGKPEIQKGDNVIYFALNEPELLNKLKPLFRKVTIDPQKRIFTKDADIPSKTQIFRCEGFKGGVLP